MAQDHQRRNTQLLKSAGKSAGNSEPVCHVLSEQLVSFIGSTLTKPFRCVYIPSHYSRIPKEILVVPILVCSIRSAIILNARAVTLAIASCSVDQYAITKPGKSMI